jgi:hypothetical protein
MLVTAASFALLVPLQNVKIDYSSPCYPVSSPTVGIYTITHCGGCLLRSIIFPVFFFTPNAVYVHSPVIPCTYLLLVSETLIVLLVQLC